jgi:lipopolysaccharide export system protein LptC
VETGRYVGIALLLALALGTLLLLPRDEPEPGEAPAVRAGIGYYLDQAELVATGEDGRVIYRLSADTAQQDLAGGGIELDRVELVYDALLEVDWQVRADRGSIPADGRIVMLSGDVLAIAERAPEPPTAIRTDYLELDPEAYIASTDALVLIERPGGTIRARGLRLYLREDRVQLLAEVEGRFAPR